MLYIVSGPSGCGKTSLLYALRESVERINISISHTTRPRRPKEKEGTDYFFVSPERFKELVEVGDFLEYATVFGHLYGTSRSWVEQRLAQGEDVVLEIDWQGARQIKERFPKAIGIFILPPDLATLEERLRQRGQDDTERIRYRMQGAVEETSHCPEYDYCIVNENFSRALEELHRIVEALRAGRRPDHDRNVEPDFGGLTP